MIIEYASSLRELCGQGCPRSQGSAVVIIEYASSLRELCGQDARAPREALS